jgi:enterobacteria phage integrase
VPAHRQRARRNWPTGLYANTDKKTGVVYYRYYDPQLRKFVGLGRDFNTARTAAANRNAELVQSPLEKYVKRLSGALPVRPFGLVCDTFLDDVRARRTGRGGTSRERSEKTLQDYEGYCRRFREHFGADTPMASITLAQISDYLDEYGNKKRARNMARGLLIQIWASAMARGWHTENLPERTLKVAHEVMRQRLTIEQFEAITKHAKDEGAAWFAAACRFALYCDQRRGDVASLPPKAWNEETDTLTFVQEKTGHVVIVKAGPKLRAAIDECLAIPPARASAIIRRPGRVEAVSDDTLTKTFQRFRDELIAKKHKAWKAYKPSTPGKPTWHEIRSLGAHLAELAKKDARKLAGHAGEQMHRMYQEGHTKVFEAESL